MCGIFAVCHAFDCAQKFDLTLAQKLSKRQEHRGPDYRDAYQHPTNGNILCHERLAIMDLNCTQPIQGRKADHQVVHNGEIYNHHELYVSYFSEVKFKTTCDSEILIHLYDKFRDDKIKLCNMLRGVFSFALIFEDEFFVARDPIGIKQLYYGSDGKGRYLFSSEMKVIEDNCGSIELAPFPSGHYWTPQEGFVQYYNPIWFDHTTAVKQLDLIMLREALIESTEKRLMSDAPIGVLLSGGLDSSLISAIASRKFHLTNRKLNSFSIGLDHNAPDVRAARRLAKYLDTVHHEIYFTVEEGIANLKNLIWHLESYDVTTVRASTPMYFLSKHIHKLGIKTVLSGEGADEIFGGYLYFHLAPNPEELQKELIRRVRLLPTADCLRADKSCMANSLEIRVPFLDRKFLDIAMSIHPKYKKAQLENSRNIEKWILRKAFDTEDRYLPNDILWRQKEQFSDGVGYNWIDTLINYCASEITDEEMASAATTFPHNTPQTKEAYYIRKLFHEHYPSDNAAKCVVPWTPKWQENNDPSGRANDLHEKALSKTQNESVQNNGIKNNCVGHSCF